MAPDPQLKHFGNLLLNPTFGVPKRGNIGTLLGQVLSPTHGSIGLAPVLIAMDTFSFFVLWGSVSIHMFIELKVARPKP